MLYLDSKICVGARIGISNGGSQGKSSEGQLTYIYIYRVSAVVEAETDIAVVVTEKISIVINLHIELSIRPIIILITLITLTISQSCISQPRTRHMVKHAPILNVAQSEA